MSNTKYISIKNISLLLIVFLMTGSTGFSLPAPGFSGALEPKAKVSNFEVLTRDTLCVGAVIRFKSLSKSMSDAIPTDLHWHFGDGTDTWSRETPVHIYSKEGKYTVKLVTYFSSTDSVAFSKEITINAVPKFAIDVDKSGPPTQRTLFVVENFPSYFWTPGNNTGQSKIVFENGKYTVTVTDNNKCSASSSVTVADITPPGPPIDTVSVEVENNILTPNGDFRNDYLKIKDFDMYSAESIPIKIFIYNVWGEMVYKNENYTNDWNGVSSEGKELTAGTYYYLIKISKRNPARGFIDIVK